MDEHGLTWRPINRDDVPALARLVACNERVDQAGVFKREGRNNPNKAKPGKKMSERYAANAPAAEGEAAPEA